MLLTSNTPLMKRHRIKSKVMKKDTMQILTKRNLVLTSGKIDLQVQWEIKKFQSGQSPGSFTISKYIPNDIASVYIKQKWQNWKET